MVTVLTWPMTGLEFKPWPGQWSSVVGISWVDIEGSCELYWHPCRRVDLLAVLVVDIGMSMVSHTALRGHARLTVLRLYSGHTVWQDQSNQYCTKPRNSCLPFAPLCTITPDVFRSSCSALTYSSLEALSQNH